MPLILALEDHVGIAVSRRASTVVGFDSCALALTLDVASQNFKGHANVVGGLPASAVAISPVLIFPPCKLRRSDALHVQVTTALLVGEVLRLGNSSGPGIDGRVM